MFFVGIVPPQNGVALPGIGRHYSARSLLRFAAAISGAICATAGVPVQQAKGILITALVAVAVVALYHNDMIPGIKGAKKLGA